MLSFDGVMRFDLMSDFIREVWQDWRGGRGLLQFRYYRKWRRSLEEGASSIRDRMPWISYDAIRILERHLTQESSVFEFGAGGSTLFFLDRVARVYSVEHNPEWINILRRVVAVEEQKRWCAYLCEPTPCQSETHFTPSDPEGYLSEDEMFIGKSFREYAMTINCFGASEFDVVLVDGRARPSCIMHSLDKVKPGGLLVVDNAERKYYLKNTIEYISKLYKPVLQTMGAIAYNRTFTKTAIWQKL